MQRETQAWRKWSCAESLLTPLEKFQQQHTQAESAEAGCREPAFIVYRQERCLLLGDLNDAHRGAHQASAAPFTFSLATTAAETVCDARYRNDGSSVRGNGFSEDGLHRRGILNQTNYGLQIVGHTFTGCWP